MLESSNTCRKTYALYVEEVVIVYELLEPLSVEFNVDCKERLPFRKVTGNVLCGNMCRFAAAHVSLCRYESLSILMPTEFVALA